MALTEIQLKYAGFMAPLNQKDSRPLHYIMGKNGNLLKTSDIEVST